MSICHFILLTGYLKLQYPSFHYKLSPAVTPVSTTAMTAYMNKIKVKIHIMQPEVPSPPCYTKTLNSTKQWRRNDCRYWSLTKIKV
jgi:hypothetical protein